MKEKKSNAKTKLAKMRKAKGLTQEKFAEILHMDDTTYSKRETGQKKIDIKEWEKYAEVLDCKVSDIFEEDIKYSIIFNDKATGNYCVCSINTMQGEYNELQKKYLKILEDDNFELKQLVKKLTNNFDS